MILIVLFSLYTPSFSLNACEYKLQKKLWPVDCFLALTNNNETKDSAAYTLLDQWCDLHQDELVLNAPPEALFSLFLPKTCAVLANKSRKHHQNLKLLDGSFLNSFL